MKAEENATEWRRAVLPLAVLALLNEGEHHGYWLLQQLATVGLGQVKGGTLYPLLGHGPGVVSV